MKIAVLIDNNPNPAVNFHTERGMSIYFEFDGYKCLLDVGSSDQYAKNADNMGINIGDVDFLFISHGHNESTGGLPEFLKRNKKAKIFLSSHVEGKSFFVKKPEGNKNIGMDYSIVEKNRNRFFLVHTNQLITKNLALIPNIPNFNNIPKSNHELYVSDKNGVRLDDFKHEMALAVNTEKGIVLFSGCSHNGILNILGSCYDVFQSSKIIACVGGTHLIDSEDLLESDEELTQIGLTIIHTYPDIKLFTGHCIGLNARRIFSAIMNKRFNIFYVGMFFSI